MIWGDLMKGSPSSSQISFGPKIETQVRAQGRPPLLWTLIDHFKINIKVYLCEFQISVLSLL